MVGHGAVTLVLGGLLLSGCRTATTDPAAGSASSDASASEVAIERLAPGEVGLAVTAGKVLTLDDGARVLDPGMVVVREGKIVYVGAPTEVPEGYERLDLGELWASPGMVDLHSHIHGTGWWDTNDMVKPLNPDLRSRPAIDPWEPRIEVACAGGVTTMFGIPGSGTSIGGFGTLYKSKTDGGYEGMVLRDPGGMKVAFNFNPQFWASREAHPWCSLTWAVQHLNDRVAHLAETEEVENWQVADLERVHRGELPVLIHCASAEGVAGTVRTWKVRYGTQAVVSHGSWDGHLAGEFAARTGTPVNHGPRVMNYQSMRREERVLGGAAAYVAAGVPLFSLNTDAPVVPQEELFLQGTMSARLGADAYQMLQAVTIHPAKSFLVADRVGSLEVGKDADIVLTTGDPLDPRSRVELVMIDGEIQYSRREDGQIF